MKPDPVQVAETLGRFIGSHSYPRPEFVKMVHEVILDLIQENQDLKGQAGEIKETIGHCRGCIGDPYCLVDVVEEKLKPKESFKNCAVCGEPGSETQVGALTTWLCGEHREQLDEVF